jgi:hypothetical protein
VRRLAVLPWIALVASLARPSEAERTLPDYRYFRALSLDLVGRPPSIGELSAFEKPDFDLPAWIEMHLTAATYAERLRQIYMDALRLEIGPSFQFVPAPIVLRRETVLGPDGSPMYVYFRRGQRRVDPVTDGDFCLSRDDTGLEFPPNAVSLGFPHPVPQQVLDAKTVVVKPWWLYADYRGTLPGDRVGPDWNKRFPGFQLASALLVEPDGATKTASVRVCREEAQTAETGVVYVSGRPAIRKGEPSPAGRLTQPPGDSPFARASKGRAVSCLTATGFASSVQCGCGVGLQRCVPGAGPQFDPPAFVMPTRTPLDAGLPFEATPQPAEAWEKLWWGEEAKHFLDRIFSEDRDFREVLLARSTIVNGPLAQFYRYLAGATCCGAGIGGGFPPPEPLVDPAAVPEALVPEDTATWLPIGDRGPHAAGLLTMPIFLTKYGSRRARAHVLYSAFLCKDFVADNVKLAPSNETDLAKRPGCSACHQTLEPMAAYFGHITESDWTWLPTSPVATAHAEAGPAGLAKELVASPEFAPCVVQNVTQSLLGRPLTPEDDAWKTQLVKTFVDGGFRMRALVRAIVTSPRYRAGNDVRSVP